MRERKNKML